MPRVPALEWRPARPARQRRHGSHPPSRRPRTAAQQQLGRPMERHLRGRRPTVQRAPTAAPRRHWHHRRVHRRRISRALAGPRWTPRRGLGRNAAGGGSHVQRARRLRARWCQVSTGCEARLKTDGHRRALELPGVRAAAGRAELGHHAEPCVSCKVALPRRRASKHPVTIRSPSRIHRSFAISAAAGVAAPFAIHTHRTALARGGVRRRAGDYQDHAKRPEFPAQELGQQRSPGEQRGGVRDVLLLPLRWRRERPAGCAARRIDHHRWARGELSFLGFGLPPDVPLGHHAEPEGRQAPLAMWPGVALAGGTA